MKTYEEMAQSALTRGKAIRKQRNKTNKIFLGTFSGLAVCCLVIIFALGPGENVPDLKPTSVPINQGVPLPSIGLRSLAQLDEMREMILCTDEEKLDQYLRSIEGAGAKSREDLVSFLNMVDSLPILEILEGDITWISHQNITTDGGNDVVFITTRNANGDWTRVEYLVWVKDVDAAIEFREAHGEFEDSTMEGPIQSEDGRITVYAQVKRPHRSGIGYIVTWTVVVDGILARVVYYSEEVDDIHAADIFDDLTIGTLKKPQA